MCGEMTASSNCTRISCCKMIGRPHEMAGSYSLGDSKMFRDMKLLTPGPVAGDHVESRLHRIQPPLQQIQEVFRNVELAE